MSIKIQTFQELKGVLEKSPALLEEFKTDPVKAIEQFDERPLTGDKWIYRIVVSSLSLIILLIITGAIILTPNSTGPADGKIPTIFTAIGSAAIGALAGLLAPSPQRS